MFCFVRRHHHLVQGLDLSLLNNEDEHGRQRTRDHVVFRAGDVKRYTFRLLSLDGKPVDLSQYRRHKPGTGIVTNVKVLLLSPKRLSSL